ncbi:ester cyclase [Actinokineospora sp. NPDC004072]
MNRTYSPRMRVVVADAEQAAANVEITAAFIAEAVNEGDFTVLPEFAEPDIRDLSEPRVFADGLAGLRTRIAATRLRMPDLYARILDIRPADIGSVQLRLEFSGTYVGDPMAPTGRDGRIVRWRQHHLWFFRGDRACAHIGRVDRTAIDAALRG